VLQIGAAELVGTSIDDIIEATTRLLTDKQAYASRQVDQNPFGDGHAAERIVDLVLNLGESGSQDLRQVKHFNRELMIPPGG